MLPVQTYFVLITFSVCFVLSNAAHVNLTNSSDDGFVQDAPAESPAEEFKTLSYTDCGTAASIDLRAVKISSCEKTPCGVPIGEPVNVTVEFQTKSLSTPSMEHAAFWVLPGANIPIETTPSICSSDQCLFRGSDGLAFNATVMVPVEFQEMSGKLLWRVNDADGGLLICFWTFIKMLEPPVKRVLGQPVETA